MKCVLLPAWFAAMAVAGAAAQTTSTPSSAPQASAVRLPYAAVHDPQFITPADATFLHDEDRVIGVMSGATAKAYPAAILSQHGLVEDQSPKGPIAITW